MEIDRTHHLSVGFDLVDNPNVEPKNRFARMIKSSDPELKSDFPC